MSRKNNSCNNHTNIISINWTSYKLNKIIEATAQDIHHIMWKCNRNKYNTNIEENKIKINRREHVALNNFFKDKQNPREQLQKVFEIVKPILSRGVRNELYTILYECDDEMFYIPELIKWKQNKKKQKNKLLEQSLKNWQEKK